MKQFISDTYHFILSIVMLLPIHNFRIFFLRFLRMKIGKHTAICRGVDIRTPYRVSIGSNTTVNKHVVLDGRGEIFIGNNVDIAQEVNIWSLQHDYNSSTYSIEKGTVIIEDYVWLASRVTVLPGVTIGRVRRLSFMWCACSYSGLYLMPSGANGICRPRARFFRK